MKTQPEALRLADELDAIPETGADPDLIQEAAAELRRLHAENERLCAQHANLLLDTRCAKAQRDALLAALKAMLEQFNFNTITGIVHDESAAIVGARAAIKAVEGEKK